MKNQMVTRKSLGKESPFLNSMKSNNNSTSDYRKATRGTDGKINSTKLGSGSAESINTVMSRRNLCGRKRRMQAG